MAAAAVVRSRLLIWLVANNIRAIESLAFSAIFEHEQNPRDSRKLRHSPPASSTHYHSYYCGSTYDKVIAEWRYELG